MTTTLVRPADLPRLDGYQARQPSSAERALPAPPGAPVVFRPDSTLSLELPDGVVRERFDSIQVRDGVFDGVTPLGERVLVPIADVQSARVSHPAPGKTAAVAIVVGLGILASVLGAGLWLASQDQGKVVNGRALRVRHTVVLAPIAPSSGWRALRADPDVLSISPTSRARLASYWTESARGEHASVPAFSRLALTLVALGAPADLVAAAHRAALEEIEHARLAFALAEAYAGRPVTPGPLRELARASAVTASSLDDLAHESFVDGCFLEGVAAAVARAALERARDPAVREALAVIAHDESSHAELAWRIVAWCCETRGPSLLRALNAVELRLPPLGPSAETGAELAAHGCLDRARCAEIAASTRATTWAQLGALTDRQLAA